jgi:hypothetical protein
MILYLGLILTILLGEHQAWVPGYGEGPIIFQHFPAVVGLPMVAGLAFLIVILLPQAYGRIEFKVFGLSFKGAAGPVVLWLLCFLGISLTVKVLW